MEQMGVSRILKQHVQQVSIIMVDNASQEMRHPAMQERFGLLEGVYHAVLRVKNI
jgi:hypothetical protein